MMNSNYIRVHRLLRRVGVGARGQAEAMPPRPRSMRVEINTTGLTTSRRVFRATVRDLSQSGLFLESLRVPRHGDEVRINFSMPDSSDDGDGGKVVEVLGEVRRRQLIGNTGVGIRFLRLTHEDEQSIRELIAWRARRAQSAAGSAVAPLAIK